ncbi:hypothetical protein BKP42_52980 [Rhodococcus erythropolis]|uniref:hypothetical protein n=1 Tax=Rhodococcus erythropolis TaxID=1833 RepID=UPI001C0F2E4F|nr:hypothetical protein [Rhodococcus erythropolis]PBI91879.1 hypothetical protein BKP42_52980 [Rhodococcus erythropolis]
MVSTARVAHCVRLEVSARRAYRAVQALELTLRATATYILALTAADERTGMAISSRTQRPAG